MKAFLAPNLIITFFLLLSFGCSNSEKLDQAPLNEKSEKKSDLNPENGNSDEKEKNSDEPDQSEETKTGNNDEKTDIDLEEKDKEQKEPEAVATKNSEGIFERKIIGFPRIHDYSGAPADKVDALVKRAINGLGITGDSAPNEKDRVFVGKWYMAWIDETGFYGKINALWSLNGEISNLDFLLKDGNRPVNIFIVGENGKGKWPAGYMGSEHIEYPNNVPEPDDKESCKKNFCAQYSLAEADPHTDNDIPAWSACNKGSPSFNKYFSAIKVEELPNASGIRIFYEGPLTKRGDFGGSSTGKNCHKNYLFEDGKRREVFLKVGYELKADSHSLDRLHQVRNPAGNPDFTGPYSFIGGFVLTDWPNPHPLKQLQRFALAGTRDQEITWDNRKIKVFAKKWTALPGDVPKSDVVLGWADQSMTLSPFPGFVKGRAYSLFNNGPKDNADNGFCLCYVHGGIEMGGGLIHGGSYKVPGGSESFMASRRFVIHHEDPVPKSFSRKYEAETDLKNIIGRIENDGISASTDKDDKGTLAFGPYDRGWPATKLTAIFRVMIDVADSRSEEVAKIDIYDSDLDEVLVSKSLKRSDFNANFKYQDFSLSFDMTSRGGNAMETRVFWRDISYLKLDSVLIQE